MRRRARRADRPRPPQVPRAAGPVLLLLLAGAAGAMAADGKSAAGPGGRVGTPPAAFCASPAAALAGVYEAERLKVVKPCAYVTGVVRHVALEPDGDYHVRLKPDPRFSGALNAQNRRLTGGNLVVEIIPFDQKAVPEPKVGQHLLVVGPYVDDTEHNWMEIHPVRYSIVLRDWSGECNPPDDAAAARRNCGGGGAEGEH